ncbi:MAG: glycosyltransferase [Planctomycetota bacterium]
MSLDNDEQLPKLACLCCTYQRPQVLENAIESFLRQDYPKGRCEMIVLDDAGQYHPASYENWHIISMKRRFRTLGEKRNACAALSSPDVEGYVVWDDDDIYLPHTLRAHARALDQAEWSRPSLFLHEHIDGRLDARPTEGLYHGGWAFRREVFERHHGYAAVSAWEDAQLMRRLEHTGVSQADPCTLNGPYYVYRSETSGTWHITDWARNGYEELAKIPQPETLYDLKPNWPIDYMARLACGD